MSFDQHQPPTTLTSGFKGLSLIGAVVATFIATPKVYYASVGWFSAFTAKYYSNEFVPIVELGWLGIVAFTIFFLVRVLLSLAFSGAGHAIVERLLNRKD